MLYIINTVLLFIDMNLICSIVLDYLLSKRLLNPLWIIILLPLEILITFIISALYLNYKNTE